MLQIRTLSCDGSSKPEYGSSIRPADAIQNEDLPRPGVRKKELQDGLQNDEADLTSMCSVSDDIVRGTPDVFSHHILYDLYDEIPSHQDEGVRNLTQCTTGNNEFRLFSRRYQLFK